MQTGSTFAILLGGELVADDRVRALVAGARTIAADGGIVHAAPLGLIPELWVGDFDSVAEADLARWADVPRRTFPAAKDQTDGELAVEEAIARGARRLVFVGALKGERTDHAGLHLLQAIGLAERGLDVVLTSGTEEAVPVIGGVLTVDLPAGALFSVLPFSTLEDLSLTGVRYPLDRVMVDFGSSWTLSNVAEGPVEIRLGAGRAIAISRPHDFSGV
jgi:thiamine pyrophosphokinase